MAEKPGYRILTIQQEPFTMYDKSTGLWSGFCIDLIKELQSILNFTYEIREPHDMSYGILNYTTLEWNGMIRELIDDRADMIVSSMWMTRIRETAIDYTEPFYDMNGISTVMMDNKRRVPFFKFVTILDTDVWFSFFGVFILTSLLLYFFERFSPYSFRNRKENSKNEERQRFYHLKECFWFSLTSFTIAGGGEIPNNWSGKVCAVTWWLFGFIIMAAYTANLAAHQTLVRMQRHVETMDDLRRQYQIEYSTVYRSSTYFYFKAMVAAEEFLYEKWERMSLNEDSTDWEKLKLNVWNYPFDDSYTKMLSAMSTSGFPSSIEEGVARVRGINQTRPFAFVTEEVTVRYLVLTSCDLIPVGEPIAKKPYAIAVPQGSDLKRQLNYAIRKLYADGRIDVLKRKWWDENPARIYCGHQPELNDGIGMDYMGAVFCLILLGITLTVLILCIQYWWYYYVPRAVLKNRKGTITITNVVRGDIDSVRT